MLDFLIISTRTGRRGIIEIYPRFKIGKSSDLMIRGGDFYAIWMEEKGLWSTDEDDATYLIDKELDAYAKEHYSNFDGTFRVLHMWDSQSGVIDSWHKYCQKQSRDCFKMLDEKLIFLNSPTNKKDYASKRLNYPLEEGDCPGYDKLMSTLYSEKERHKIEWAIGSIVSGDSKNIQKFIVLYGAAGTGKSTILNIIQQLFEGYYSVFDAKALGSSSNSFALEAFKCNPLVAIQHDGDLSKIEDNTRLNSLVSHELMTVNEKFKSTYANRFKCFLFMGTNRPVKITDAKSGLIRRLIDVTPSGKKLNSSEYKKATNQISFELGAIAYHCLKVYQDNPGAYDNYIPISMLGASNDFYNYVIDYYHVFLKEDGTTLKTAWEMYKTYCNEAKVSFPLSKRNFKEELKNYFWEFNERFIAEDGSRLRSYFKGFRTDKFESDFETSLEKNKDVDKDSNSIIFKAQKSILDDVCGECLAQYANDSGTPSRKWDNIISTLRSIDTSKLHYVKLPINHIVIDFDLKDDTGKKSYELNLKEASKWPPTYAELSKSGSGIHLHYIYSGDISKLSRIYDDEIEIKIFTGNSSLRRKLTKCNDLPIATINSGLPTKGENKMIDIGSLYNEKALRTLIKRNLNKEYHGATTPSVHFINKALEDAYSSGMKYDVSDLKNDIIAFAANSTNQASTCLKIVSNMKFKSEYPSESIPAMNNQLIFYDIEVFPNLFLVNWKLEGKDKPIVRMINPKPSDIEELIKFNLVGFNCRRYDNHLLYARLMGYTNEQLYSLSQEIINNGTGFFGEAYNISYTDVYDFSSKKQSLKKFEIELGIHHQELGLPWDKPVPKEMWEKVAEYCDNDVIATEEVFNNRKADFAARQILAGLAKGTANDTTNSLSTKIIFGNNKKPQDQFNYRDMGDISQVAKQEKGFDEYTVFDNLGRPIFPGYKYEAGVSIYRGEEIGEGGYVYSEPGMYSNVALLDVASMHPSSIIAENLFGDIYTKRFQDIKEARVTIKHHDFEKARTMLEGALTEYINELDNGTAWYTAEDLAQALKIVINSIYGLTAASFDNPFRDKRNVDNIVAKRGALFMVNLKHEVQKKGYTVAHIKTDSIKIPNADSYIIDFVMEYGKMYGYIFEHEATYDRMCLVNDAVYIAKYKDGKHAGEWTATGTQFQIPYVFKKLFSKEPIEFEDMCETKSVSTALYLDMNEKLPDVSVMESEYEKLRKKINDPKRFNEPMYDECARLEELTSEIEKGHNYIFIGKVGNFCPIKIGFGGGLLVREKDGKYYAVTGSKGYRWLESEMVKTLNKETDIDVSYYNKLVDEAIETISKYGDFEWFISNDSVDNDDLPWIDNVPLPSSSQ